MPLLTAAAVENAKPKEKPYKLYDTGGLFIIIAPTGGKWWRLKYRVGGKEKLLSLGTYPTTGLKEARDKRDEAKKLIAGGIDPSIQRQSVKASVRAEVENAFEVVAREWFNNNKETWVDSHAEKIIRRLENYIFPIIGGRPIEQIKAPELLEALRGIEARGIPDVAHRALQNCSRIFRYAVATGRAERDTAVDLRGALVPVKPGHLAAITDPKKFGELLRDIDCYLGEISIHYALKIMPYVFVRSGELRGAHWAEFDLEGATWKIPAERMKMRQDHIVPLARQVVTLLEELSKYTGHSDLVFPSPNSATRCISDMGLLNALRRMGYDRTQTCIHGFRSTASTLLNERGYRPDVIEAQLAHGERNAVRAAYNRAEYLDERRAMMQEWADYLDNLREGKSCF